jgi:tRNA pseudouridine13 synthase
MGADAATRSFIFKHRPEDFRVQEGLVLEKCARDEARTQYLMLRKSGVTTQAAIEAIARKAGIASLDISYGGRKDEDGITEQVIAAPVEAELPDGGWEQEWPVEGGWIGLCRIGYGRERIRIGQVGGNCFRTVVRNLAPDEVARLVERGRSSLFCLNYYDTQRFGMPNGPKLTHLVGGALFAEQWDDAAALLAVSGAPDARRLADWRGGAADFFGSLEPRVRDFYLAAYESSLWNDALAELVRTHCAVTAKGKICVEGLNYHFVDDRREALKVLQAVQELPYRRHDSSSGETRVRMLSRPTVVQVVADFGEPESDTFFPSRLSLPISFMLPSGCYATMVLRQIELQLL